MIKEQKGRPKDVLGKPLGSNWRIFRWSKVTIRKKYLNGNFCVDHTLLFKTESTAKKFARSVKAKYPHWETFWCYTYVLSGNNGKTGVELEGNPTEPRTTGRVQQIYVPDGTA